MKNALLLIPSNLNDKVDRTDYLNHCIRNAMRAGYMPYTPDLYEMFNDVSRKEYVDRLLLAKGVISTVLFFIDYSVDSLMFDLLYRVKDDDIEIVNVRLPEKELRQCSPTALSILADVSKKTAIPLEILVTRTRRREVVDARYVYFRRAKEKTKASLREIGIPVGKDHASVLAGIRVANNVKAVMNLYNRLYGQTEIETPPLVPCQVTLTDGGPQKGSVLPHQPVEAREFCISEKKSIVPEMRKAGVYLSVGSY